MTLMKIAMKNLARLRIISASLTQLKSCCKMSIENSWGITVAAVCFDLEST